MIRRLASVGVFAMCAATAAAQTSAPLPAGYPPLLKELQSVPRLVRQHAAQSRGDASVAEAVGRARSACDAAMPKWNAWVDALTNAVVKGEKAPTDFQAASDAAGQAAISCAPPRLAAAKQPPIPDNLLKAEQTRLSAQLNQIGTDIIKKFGREPEPKRQASVTYLNETLRWAPWDDAR